MNEVSKLSVVELCSELASYGIGKSDFYFMDFDGKNNGALPMKVHCQFPQNTITVGEKQTILMYGWPDIRDIKMISYDQSKALVMKKELSCTQEIYPKCWSPSLEVKLKL